MLKNSTDLNPGGDSNVIDETKGASWNVKKGSIDNDSEDNRRRDDSERRDRDEGCVKSWFEVVLSRAQKTESALPEGKSW